MSEVTTRTKENLMSEVEESRVGGHWLVSLAQLDDEQKFIAALKPGESFMVEGCAGSGKSVLAIIKFNQLCQEGGRPVYATMMRGLTDTIITEVLESDDDGMAPSKQYVGSRTNRMRGRDNIDHGKPWYYKSSCIGTCSQLPCLNPNSRSALVGQHLVLDECQDLSYQDFLNIIERGGYQSICWYGDDDQQLADGLGDEKKHVRMHEIFEQCFAADDRSERWFKLAWNYRISKNAAKFIDEFQKVLPEERKMLALSARGKRTEKPFLCGYSSVDEEVAAVVDVIKNRKWNIKNGHSTAILVGGTNQQVEEIFNIIQTELGHVLGPRNVDVQRRHGETVAGADNWVTADPSAPIIVSTPLASKGCQFDSVFVLADTFGRNSGHLLSPKDLNAIHVAMTRSGGDLFIFYVGAMPPAFDQIPISLYESSLSGSAETDEDLWLE